MKFQRRDSVEPEMNDKKEDCKPKKKEYSIVGYVVALFCVVIFLVLLSYFIQERRNTDTISNLTDQHTEITNQALNNIEELQNQNLSLTQKLGDAEAEIEALQQQIDELTQQLEDAEEKAEQASQTAQNVLKAEYNELLLKYQAMSYIITAEKAYDEGNAERAMEYYKLLEPIEGKLPADWTEEYAELKKNLGVE